MSIANLLTGPAKEWAKLNLNTVRLDGTTGFLKLNDMTTAQTGSLVQLPGMLIYNTTTGDINVSNGTTFFPVPIEQPIINGTITWEDGGAPTPITSAYSLRKTGNIVTLSVETSVPGLVPGGATTIDIPGLLPVGYRPIYDMAPAVMYLDANAPPEVAVPMLVTLAGNLAFTLPAGAAGQIGTISGFTFSYMSA